jgi:autotransporter-associated beta strand protein
VTKNGVGSVTLAGNNTYTGPTVVNNGTLALTGAYPSASVLTVSAGGALSLVNGSAAPIATPTLSLGAGTGTATLSLELAAPGSNDAINVSGSATVANTIRFDISALGGFAPGNYTLLSAAGGGLNGSAVYQVGAFPSGFGYNLIPSANTVLLDVFAITPTSGPIFFTGSGSTSWASLSGGNSQTFASDLAGTTPSVGTPNSTNTVNFSSTAASVVGPTVTTTLDGNHTINDLVFNANTQSGTVTAVQIQPGNSPGNTLTISPASATAGINLQTGAPAQVAISAPVALGANQTWTVADATSTLTVSGALSGTATLTKAGAGIVRFANTNFAGYSGGIAVAAGTLQLDAATAAITVPNVISGPGVVTKTGANTLTLSGANTFAGGLTLAEGTLNINSATAAGTGTFTIAGGTLGNTSGAAVTFTNNNPQEWTGNFTKTGDTTDLGTGGVSFAADRTVTVSANSLIVGGAISGGTAGLTKAGAGVLALNNAANVYSGPTSVTGGVLAVTTLASNGSPSSIGTGTTVNINNATLRYTGSASAATNRNTVLTTAGTIDLANTTTDLTVELSGVISGAGSLTKVSSSTPVNNTSNLILSGNNTFTGNVTISNGNLTIRNSSALGTGTKTVTLTAGTSGAPSLRLDPGVGNVISLPSAISFITSFNGTNATNPNAFGSIDSRTGDNVIAGTFTLASGGGSTALYVAAGSSLTLTGGLSPNTTARFLDLRGEGTGLISGVIANGSTTNTLGVTRSGGGVWTLTGNNTYSVGTTISSGMLLVANSAGSGTGTGAVNVNGTGATNARGVLGGTGSVAGLVNVNVTSGVLGGMVRAGNADGVGTLTLAGGLNIASGGRIGVQLLDGSTFAAPNTGGSTLGTLPNTTSNNFLNITGGTTTLSSGTVIAVDATGVSFAPEQSYSFLVGQGAGAQNLSITDPGQFVLSGFSLSPSAVSFTANNAGNMYLNLTFPIPEPGTAGVVAAAGLLLLRRTRRRAR